MTALAHKNLPTVKLMQEWGDAVEYNPEVIKFKVNLFTEVKHSVKGDIKQCEHLSALITAAPNTLTLKCFFIDFIPLSFQM